MFQVPPWSSGAMVLRVHTATLPSEAKFRVDCRATAPSTADPAQFFRGPILSTAVVTTVADLPLTVTCPLAEPSGTLAFFLSATRGTVSGDFRMTLSVAVMVASYGDDWTPLALGSKLTL